MLGCLRPEQVTGSLTCEEFDQLQAYNKVLPIDHGPKMLGFIAYLLGKELIKDADLESLRFACMPWLEAIVEVPVTGQSAAQAVRGGM